jgi:hypothetical protein
VVIFMFLYTDGREAAGILISNTSRSVSRRD